MSIQQTRVVAVYHRYLQHQNQPTLVSLHDLQGEDDPSVLLAQLRERSPPRFFPRVVRDGDQMAFLYEGDAAYESGDLSEQGAEHRTLGAQGIFRYVGAD